MGWHGVVGVALALEQQDAAKMEYAVEREARLAVRAVTLAVRKALLSSSCWKVVLSIVAAAAMLLR